MRLLLIEDDTKVSEYIVNGFKESGHTIDSCISGTDGLHMAMSEQYDVAIIDRMLPGMDGITIIKALRGSEKTLPVLILSALGQVDDRVEGLRAGGDDYLVKPFAFSELLARVEVLARRTSNPLSSSQISKLTANGLEMDLLSRKVVRDGQSIDLQPREFRLLEYLLRNKSVVVTRTMLLEGVWDYNFDPQTNVIDVHISRLRSKLDKGFTKPLIKTVRGAGYIIEE